MPHHYKKNITEDLHWYNRCGRRTRHAVSAGRLGRCSEHEAQFYTKDQLKRLERKRREAEQPSLFP